MKVYIYGRYAYTIRKPRAWKHEDFIRMYIGIVAVWFVACGLGF